jgi:hypothetical protein
VLICVIQRSLTTMLLKGRKELCFLRQLGAFRLNQSNLISILILWRILFHQAPLGRHFPCPVKIAGKHHTNWFLLREVVSVNKRLLSESFWSCHFC